MTLTSDITLYHPLWEKTDNDLCDKDGIGLFKRLIDAYILAAAIGIREDRCITTIEDPLEQPKTIGRNTYQSQLNTDLFDVLEFMLQNAIINSSTVSYSTDERLKLAFDPDYYVDKLKPAEFLTGFANYGITKIYDSIDSSSSIVAIHDIYKYLDSQSSDSIEELLSEITLENLD